MKYLFIYIEIETTSNNVLNIDVNDILRWGKDNEGYFIIFKDRYSNTNGFYITRESFLRVVKYKSKGK